MLAKLSCYTLLFIFPFLTCAQGERILLDVGYAGVFDHQQVVTAKLGYEAAPLMKLQNIRPVMQFMLAETGAYHFSLGAIRDFPITERWAWSASTSLGYYQHDNDQETEELGYELEFYTSVSTTYRVNQQLSVRAELGHISNAGLGTRNPGSEILLFSTLYAF